MKESIVIRKLPEGLMPQNVGEMSFAQGVPCPEHRDEWRVKLPCGHTIALVEPIHRVFETDEKSAGVFANHGITVNPSIVCPNGDWHGFIVYSRMSEV
jgi:hypothetical protein